MKTILIIAIMSYSLISNGQVQDSLLPHKQIQITNNGFTHMNKNERKRFIIRDTIIEKGLYHPTIGFNVNGYMIGVQWTKNRADSMALLIGKEKIYITPDQNTYMFQQKSNPETFQIMIIVGGKRYFSDLYKLWVEEEKK